MEHAEAGSVRRELLASWGLGEPLSVDLMRPGGATSDVFDVKATDGRRFAAKLTYDLPGVVESGLRAAEFVQRSSGVKTGMPVRSINGSLTVETDSVAGLRHPLALMEWVDGATVQVEERPEECGRLLAIVHESLAGSDVSAPDTVIGYLQDRSVDYNGRDAIEHVLRDAVDAVIGLDGLTWGTCYGDGPELMSTLAGLALIDWGAVTRAPLLWDVVQWAASAGTHAGRFVSGYVDAGGPAADEMHYFPVVERLAAAHQLRFRLFRLANGNHYDESAIRDREALIHAATMLGVDHIRILEAIA